MATGVVRAEKEAAAHTPAERPRREGAAVGPVPVVVLIDDDASLYGPVRIVVDEALGPAAILAHYTGAAPALRDLASRRPDVILLDLKLPDLDGVTALKWIKGSPGLARVPVILLSAETYWPTLSIALDAGADSYVFKPFDPETLASVVLDAFRRSRDRAAEDPRPPDRPQLRV